MSNMAVSVKDLYRAYIENRPAKAKIILLGEIEGRVVGVKFERDRNGFNITSGLIKDNNCNSFLWASAEYITLI